MVFCGYQNQVIDISIYTYQVRFIMKKIYKCSWAAPVTASIISNKQGQVYTINKLQQFT